jgi:hypothetical protein
MNTQFAQISAYPTRELPKPSFNTMEQRKNSSFG